MLKLIGIHKSKSGCIYSSLSLDLDDPKSAPLVVEWAKHMVELATFQRRERVDPDRSKEEELPPVNLTTQSSFRRITQ